MQPILIVIPFWSGNAVNAETLVDFIYHFGGKRKLGCALPVAGADVHVEAREKIKISCGLAFEHFEMIQLPKSVGDKAAQIANTFKLTAQFIQMNYKTPWLWLEPDCTPTKPKWLLSLWADYEHQQKLVMRNADRVGIYPPDYFSRMEKPGTNMVATSGLIQSGGTPGKETVLFHGDKDQMILKRLRNAIAEAKP